MAPYATGTDSPHLIEDPLRAAASYDVSQITVIASSRAVVNDRLTPATLIISNTTGKILAVFEYLLNRSHFPERTSYTDYSPRVLLPGLVDAHVHLNEPGRTEWEGFWTGTRAAAFGGVTTVVDMPLNAIPPTTTVAGMKEKVAAAQGKCWVDVAFYGGIVPGNAAELKPLIREGVRGFKGFLIDSGVEEFPAVSPDDIRAVFAELSDEPTTVMFHAEMLPCNSNSEDDGEGMRQRVDSTIGFLPPANDLYQTFLDSRPSSLETQAIQQILSLAHLAPNLPLHIVHLSAVEAIPLLRAARKAGINITAETCPHYLSLAAEDIRAGDTRAKCCPPIRNQANQDGLWAELLAESQPQNDREDPSVIRTVVSDHSPCTPNLKLLPASIPSGAHSHSHGQEHDNNGCAHKQHEQAAAPAMSKDEGDFMAAWGGISSVGLGLPIMWTEAVHHRNLSPTTTLLNLVRWCCVNTAQQVGLEHRKGSLSVGMDADIAVFDPEAAFEVRPDTMLFRNKCSPYEGRVLRGVVAETWVRGRKVYSRDGGFERDAPNGELLLEPRKKSIVA